MPSLTRVANRDKRTPATVNFSTDEGKIAVQVEFYLNRVTGSGVPEERVDDYLREQGDDDLAGDNSERVYVRNALGFCDYMASWDLGGPLLDGTGQMIVAAEEVIPLEPRYVRWVPAEVTGAINDKMLGLVNPNLNRSRASRRR